MYTVDASLSAAMENNNFAPYLLVEHGEDRTADFSAIPISFKIHNLYAEVKFQTPRTDDADFSTFRIKRGAYIDGVPTYLATNWFYANTISFKNGIVSITGHILLKNVYQAISANSNYQTVIESVLGSYSLTATYEGGTPAWLAYQFYPDGKSIIFSEIQKLFTVLKQKYLLDATYNGDNDILFFVASATKAVDYIIVDEFITRVFETTARYQIWRDENNTVHTNGFTTRPIHNLGYLESAAVAPTNSNSPTKNTFSKLLPNLKYQTGDYVQVNPALDIVSRWTGRIDVEEILDPAQSPPWHMIIRPCSWYESTEGGPMPSTLVAAAPYTPLSTTEFTDVLTEQDNNVQAAFETLNKIIRIGTALPTDPQSNQFFLNEATGDFYIYTNTWLLIATATITAALLLEDGASFLLLEDASSHILME